MASVVEPLDSVTVGPAERETEVLIYGCVEADDDEEGKEFPPPAASNVPPVKYTLYPPSELASIPHSGDLPPKAIVVLQVAKKHFPIVKNKLTFINTMNQADKFILLQTLIL